MAAKQWLFMEDRVRERLAKEFGMPFRKRHLKMKGGVEHEFDLVSEDRSIIVEVKTNGPNMQKGDNSVRQAVLEACARDCLLLLSMQAKRRILVLTNPIVHDKFLRTEYGRVAQAHGIEIRHVPVS